MIKLFSAGLIFAVFLNPAKASETMHEPELKTRTIKIDRSFNKIIVNGDAHIVFVKGIVNEITIEERAAIENTVKIMNEAGVLRIESKDIYKGKKPLVLIPVSQLQVLEMNGNGSVATATMLPSKELKVLMNGECEIQIVSSGRVSVESSPDYHLNYRKQKRHVFNALQKR